MTVKSIVQKVLKKNIGLAVTLAFVIAGVVLASLVPPQLLKRIIDNNFVGRTKDGLLSTAIFYMIVLVLIGVFDFIKEALLTIFGQKITKDIRTGMMQKMHKLDQSFFSSNTTGAVVSRFTNDVDAIQSIFTGGLIGMMIDCFKIIGIIASIWMFQAKLGAATILILPFIYWITRLFQRKMLKAQIENRIITGVVNNHISESFKNILMIKSFSKEKYMENIYKKHLTKNFDTAEKVNFYDSIFSPIILLMRAIFIAGIVILSSKQISFFGISLGMIAATMDLISGLFHPIESLGMELQAIQQAISGMKRVNDFYQMPAIEMEDNQNEISKQLGIFGADKKSQPNQATKKAGLQNQIKLDSELPSDKAAGQEITPSNLANPELSAHFANKVELNNSNCTRDRRHENNSTKNENTTESNSTNYGLRDNRICKSELTISFENVSFQYEDGIDVLNDITFSITPNEKVTVAGRTGVGKTTLFKLMLGLLEPSKGKITLNGVDIFKIPNSLKRSIFGYVDQSFHQIKGTVADQISLKDRAITKEQILEALEFVGMKEYVQLLENGLDTLLTNDTLFSAGQKQLLAIARAIVTNPPILLLDEITANLDSITESQIIKVLTKASDSRTIISISHRLTSIISCDSVVIIENGRIKSKGTPEELLTNDEWYKDNLMMEELVWA